MNALPPAFGGDPTVVQLWRLDRQKHGPTWNSGEGAFQAGGRWNSEGVRAIYCSIDPSTAIIEVAVHKGFAVLDSEPHVLSQIGLSGATGYHVVQRADVPNPNWLRPADPTKSQQKWGDALIAAHPIVIIPSVVSENSWNVILRHDTALGATLLSQEPFALDPRLHP